jgi:NADH-quinone oxidoreductase subunit H
MMSLCWKYFIPFSFICFVGELAWVWLMPTLAARIVAGVLFAIFGVGFGGWFIGRVRDNARRYHDLVLNDALGRGNP